MKFLTAATATTLVTLLPAVKADFVLFAQGIGGGGIIDNAWGWQAYSSSEPSCDDVHSWIWRKKDDVSGGKYGVRCKGSCGSSSDPAGFEEVEMNFNSDDLHFTWYEWRDGWALYDLSDNQIGTCEPLDHPGYEFYCGQGIQMAIGQAKLSCTTDVTAEQIADNAPSGK